MSSDPAPVTHTFSLPKLAYEQEPNTQNYIRIQMFFKKKQGISHEYFAHHWRHVHADLLTASKAFQENRIMRYKQFYQTPEMKRAVEAMGYPVMEWDASSEFWVASLDDMVALSQSEEYIRHTGKLAVFFERWNPA
jgi:hypothetical protein